MTAHTNPSGKPSRRRQWNSAELRSIEEQLFPDGFTLRDEANAVVAMAFRNGPIEDLHAGKQSELLADPTLSRITDEEMKTLMTNACRKMAELLHTRETEPEEYYRQMMAWNRMYCRHWER